MSGYTYFDDDEAMHSVAFDYIELIKKKTKGGVVRYDSGDFLALDQHDRKRVVTSLLEYEQGFRILDTLKIRIQKSEMPPENKVELLGMIVKPEPVVVAVAVVAPPEVPLAPVAVEEPKVEAKKTIMNRIFNILGGKRGN